jgi:hypothetical protein
LGNIGNTFVGICLGASTLSLVEMQEIGKKITVVNTITQAHLGNVRLCLLDILGRHEQLFYAKFCVTGRKLRHALHLSSIAEPEAVELAIKHILPESHPYRIVISAEGETFIVYHLAESGFIQHIQAGNKCESGTGEFFLQQLHRMDLLALKAIVIGDLFDEMWATILAAATDTVSALEILYRNYDKICNGIDGGWTGITKILQECAEELSRIPLVKPYNEIPKISLVGEIYVRHDPISLQHLVERMAKRGFIVRTAQSSEWLKYLDWLIKKKILGKRTLSFWMRHFVKGRTDRQIRRLLAPSGLFYNGDMRVEGVVNSGSKYISPELQGETILTVGSAFHEILNPACGVISLGPFGCMPNRVAEAILKEKFTTREKRAQLNGQPFLALPLDGDRKFPFLAIETDGNPFPQIIEARLESFCLQAERLHQEMLHDILLQTDQLKN